MTTTAQDRQGDEYGLDAMQDTHAYREWWAKQRRRPAQPAPGEGPRLSLLVVVGGPHPAVRPAVVHSLRRQSYRHWDLHVLDNDAGGPPLRAYLGLIKAVDRRVRTLRLSSAGTMGASLDEALQQASGEFVAVLSPGDKLAAGALAAAAAQLADQPEIDLLYSDDDELDPSGPCRPRFKPDWSPDYSLSLAFVGRLALMRRSTLIEAGGFDVSLENAAEHDAVLKVADRARQIVHLPQVLCHRRPRVPVPGDAAVSVVAEALARRGAAASVDVAPYPAASFHPRWHHDVTPVVSIVVSVGRSATDLRACMDGLLGHGYDQLEVVLATSGDQEPDTETAAVVELMAQRPGVHVVAVATGPGWAAARNEAAAKSRGEILLFLDATAQPRHEQWLAALVEHALRPDVGVVGAHLLYADGSTRHAGTVLGLGGPTGDVMAGLPAGQPGYLGWAALLREVSAVSGSCLMIRRALFDELGHFDERYRYLHADAHLCLRAADAGYRILYTPHSELVWRGRPPVLEPAATHDQRAFMERWGERVRSGDPYFNANLSRLDPRCVVRPPDEDERWEQKLAALTGSGPT